MCNFTAFSENEDFDMTFQVALAGKDGFVIASDRKGLAGGGPTGTGRILMRHTSEMRKILVSKSGNLVFAFSGSHIAADIAEDVRSAMASRERRAKEAEVERARKTLDDLTAA